MSARIYRSVAILVVLVLGAACAPSSDGDRGIVPRAEDPSPQPSPLIVTPDEDDFTFAVIGDWGSGLDGEFDVADRMCRWRKKYHFDHVLTTGDNIYPDGHPDDFEAKFFEPFDCLLDAGVKWHAALGNHDVVTDNGRPEIEEPLFGIRKRNYVLRKAGVRFVIVDSNALKIRFLRKATKAQEGDDWTVVFFHHPVFSGGDSHGATPGLAEKVTELFGKRGVDIVFHGHDHVYSRSKPVGGVRYVVTGGGGASLNGCRPAVAITRCVSRHHFLYVIVKDHALRVMAVPASGTPFDSFKVTGN